MIKDLIVYAGLALCFVGPGCVAYLVFIKFLKTKNLLIQIVAPVLIFCVGFVVTFYSLLVVGAIPFQR